MQIVNSRYEITAVNPSQYPMAMQPEVVFVGRSNVGKSSIINTLTNRKNLARVGATPGKTKEINFYNIDEKFYFVDVPGYGFAKTSHIRKRFFEDVVETYLYSRKQIQMVVLLLDIRHEPTEDDKLMYNWLIHNPVPFMIVANKFDKITKAHKDKYINVIKNSLGLEKSDKIFLFSAENRYGKEEILNHIGETLIFDEERTV